MKLFSGLLSILEEQTRCYERIYELKESEQKFILSGQAEQLQENTGEIENLTMTVRSLEKGRLEIAESLAEKYGLSECNIDFEQVMAIADEQTGVELKRITDRLIDVITRTSRINEDNAFLIQKSYNRIDRWLHVLTNLGSQSDTYGYDGRLGTMETSTVMVNQRA